jgi:hypothetical protein
MVLPSPICGVTAITNPTATVCGVVVYGLEWGRAIGAGRYIGLDVK